MNIQEKSIRYGVTELSERELLIGTGIVSPEIAIELLFRFKTLSRIYHAGLTELEEIKGIGLKKATQIKAALELGRRFIETPKSEEVSVTFSRLVFNRLKGRLCQLEQEQFWVLLLNQKNQISKEIPLYKGTKNKVSISSAEVFREAIRENANSIIVAHNHPSGDPTPSDEDIALTKRLMEVGKLLDMKVLDHIIFGATSFVSLQDKGLM